MASAVAGESSQNTSPRLPPGMPLIRVMAMPADANPNGDIFGGWLLSQMDLAGGSLAAQRARGRCATVAVDGMVFHEPVFVGDEVSCYGELVKTGIDNGVSKDMVIDYGDYAIHATLDDIEPLPKPGC